MVRFFRTPTFIASMIPLVPSLLAISLFTSPAQLSAAEDFKPALTITAPDLARTRQRFADSIYATIWNHPLLAEARTKMTEGAEMAAQESGVNPLHVLQNLQSAHGSVGGNLDDTYMPQMRGQVDFTASAQQMWELLAQTGMLLENPVGAEGANGVLQSNDQQLHMARYNSSIVFSHNASLALQAVPTSEYDMTGTFFMREYFILFQEIMKMMPQADTAMFDMMQDTLASEKMTWNAQIVPHGTHETFAIDYSGIRPTLALDASLFNHLPKNTLLTAAFLFDSAATLAELERGGLDDAQYATMFADIDRMLQPFGTTYLELIASVNGTALIAVTNSVPFPAGTIMLPRSEKIDSTLANLLRMAQLTAPTTGNTINIPIPNVPVMVQLGCNDSHWILSSDTMAIDALMTKQAGGFADGALGALATTHCSDKTLGAGFYDTAALMNLGMNYAMFIPDTDIRMQVSDLIMKLTKIVQPGYAEMHVTPEGFEGHAEGIFGSGTIIFPIAASIAIPNLLESKLVANEAATHATLRAAIFASQVTFQAASFQDADSNGIGRYGFINELNGNKATTGAKKGDIRILTGALAEDRNLALANGYHYKIYLPNGEHAAFADADAISAANLPTEGMLENQYIIYAWPKGAESGRTVFAMSQDGQVRSMPAPYDYSWDEQNLPAWNLIFGGADAGWNDPITWAMHNNY